MSDPEIEALVQKIAALESRQRDLERQLQLLKFDTGDDAIVQPEFGGGDMLSLPGESTKPWTVEWDDDEEAFVVYLPMNESYTDANGLTESKVKNAINGLSESQRGNDWYLCPIDSGTLYLNITKQSSDPPVYYASIGSKSGDTSTPIASVQTEEDDDGNETHTVKQYTCGTIHYGHFDETGGGGGGDATIDEDVAAMHVASLQRKTHSGSGTEYIEVANFHNADSGTVPIAVYAKNERNESVKTISWEKLYVEWDVESISSPDGSFITDIKYNASNQQIQVRRRSFKTETVQIMSSPQKTIEILTQVGEESEFETITGGQCVEQIHIEPET